MSPSLDAARVVAEGRRSVAGQPPIVCFLALSAGDWGGASRVLFTNLRFIDRSRLHPLVVLPGDGPIVAELEAAGIDHLVWGPLLEPGNAFAYLRRLVRTLRMFRRVRVATVHINGAFWRPAEILAARILRIPIVAHYHVTVASPGPWMQACRAIVCVSRYTAQHSRPAGDAKPVIYNPVDLARFDAGRSLREVLGIDPACTVVAFLGQIRESKGVADFIAMAHRVADPQARFLIAGECRDPIRFPGSYSEQDLAVMAHGDTRIRYIGYVERVEDVYQTADIVVAPSRWQEPLGLINLEAGAVRRPVVATRVGGIPEVVEDGVNGFLVEPGDIAALADRVGRLVADPALRARLGAAGRAIVERRFSTQPAQAFEALLLECTGAG